MSKVKNRKRTLDFGPWTLDLREEKSMSDEKKSGDFISATIGDVGECSQVAVGSQITQTQTHSAPPVVTEAEMAQVQQMFADLRTKIEQEAPPEEKEKALERVDELKEAVTAKEPD